MQVETVNLKLRTEDHECGGINLIAIVADQKQLPLGPFPSKEWAEATGEWLIAVIHEMGNHISNFTLQQAQKPPVKN